MSRSLRIKSLLSSSKARWISSSSTSLTATCVFTSNPTAFTPRLHQDSLDKSLTHQGGGRSHPTSTPISLLSTSERDSRNTPSTGTRPRRSPSSPYTSQSRLFSTTTTSLSNAKTNTKMAPTITLFTAATPNGHQGLAHPRYVPFYRIQEIHH